MRIKRYQIWTRNGVGWSDWFPWSGSEDEKWQIKNKLVNEYTEVTEEEWKNIQEEQEKKKNIINNKDKKNGKSN